MIKPIKSVNADNILKSISHLLLSLTTDNFLSGLHIERVIKCRANFFVILSFYSHLVIYNKLYKLIFKNIPLSWLTYVNREESRTDPYKILSAQKKLKIEMY